MGSYSTVNFEWSSTVINGSVYSYWWVGCNLTSGSCRYRNSTETRRPFPRTDSACRLQTFAFCSLMFSNSQERHQDPSVAHHFALSVCSDIYNLHMQNKTRGARSNLRLPDRSFSLQSHCVCFFVLLRPRRFSDRTFLRNSKEPNNNVPPDSHTQPTQHPTNASQSAIDGDLLSVLSSTVDS